MTGHEFKLKGSVSNEGTNMKIIDVQVLQLAGPELPKVMKPAWAPGSQWRRWGGTIVKVFTDEGITGLGSPGYNISPLIESWIRPQLIGQDPFALERHARIFRNAGAGWGVEIALQADIAQIEGVRRAAGSDFTLLVDANQAQLPGTLQPEPGPVWSYERALNTARELERLGVYWLEEPLDRYDFDNLTRLAAAADILIAGGENNCGMHEYRWLIERNCYDVLQPEAMVGETMSQIRKACALAEMHHKLCAPHHGGGGLGFVAHLHLCVAIPNCPFVEVFHDLPGFSSDIFQWYLAEPIALDPTDGCMAVPQKPGLGVELDEDKIRRYASVLSH